MHSHFTTSLNGKDDYIIDVWPNLYFLDMTGISHPLDVASELYAVVARFAFPFNDNNQTAVKIALVK